jgi:trehalose 6-phosphate phosphatase
MVEEEKVEEFLRGVALAPRSVLLLDYDGTLSPFSVARKQAVPYRGVAELLQQIVNSGRTRLVIITGREAHEISPLLGLQPSPEVWGSHGLQRLRPNGLYEVGAISPKAKHALNDAERWLEHQGLESAAESKPGGVAIHWRGLSQLATFELRNRILVGWVPIAEGGSLSLIEFDGGLEMRISRPDKGDAVRSILGETDHDVPVAYLGDDQSDENAFRALGDRGLSALVRTTPRPTSAQIWLEAPAQVFEFLLGWQQATAASQWIEDSVRS